MKKSIKTQIQSLRTDYRQASLTERESSKNPLIQFEKWFQEAVNAKLHEPNAMLLATCDLRGRPSLRAVLFKELDQQGFVFYTNYLSRKGREISKNPRVALLFYWGELERQVRIEGKVKKLSRDRSQTYFASRPYSAQIGAISSPQSQALRSRDELEMRIAENKQRFEENAISCPSNWGGYCVIPDVLEFWQGRESRLHDRIEYRKSAGKWKRRRLAP